MPLYYMYGLIDGAWQPIDGRWLAPVDARTSEALAFQRGAKMIGSYVWDGTSMNWMLGS